ncbi:MAG: agmatine deiminase family protein [bacterium]
MSTIRYPAEWEEQDGVLLAWPHAGTDWQPYLVKAQETFARIMAEASHHGRVIVVTASPAEVHHFLQHTDALTDRIQCYPIPCNDTWARDFGPITVFENQHPVLLDCQFTGWGGKFNATLDNLISSKLKEHGVFGPTLLRSAPFILEGGSIETDGQGTLLTTASCNANANRNAHMSRQDTNQAFTRFLGTSRVLWLEHGYLAGDDTDGHIDMLARFAPHDTIVYQACDQAGDEHFPELTAMANELSRLRTLSGAPYRLLPLPWPAAQYDEEQHRLPVSYANFLILNGAVLVPIYNDPCDAHALMVIGKAYPGRKIIGIDCSTLILQHGSLHCVTMQLPKGTLA